MKKMIYLAALPFAMWSCGGGGAQADADKICDMMKNTMKAQKEGKTGEVAKLSQESEDFMKEVEKKYGEDKDAQKIFTERMQSCQEEITADMAK